jgi:hypothetical protein
VPKPLAKEPEHKQRRSPYYFFLVVASLYVAVKGKDLLHDLHLVQSGRSEAYVPLAKLLLILAGVFAAVYALLRERSSQSLPQSPRDGTAFADASPLQRWRHIPLIVRHAFASSPILATTMSVAILSVPIVLVAMGQAGGMKAFGLREWTLIGVMELPMAYIALVVIVSSWWHRK